MVPSSPPLRALRPEPKQGDRARPQPVRHAPLAAPVAVYQQPPARFVPVHALPPQTHLVVPVFRPQGHDTGGDAHVARRHVKTEAGGDAYERHHQQLQSMAVQHFLLPTQPAGPPRHVNSGAMYSGYPHSHAAPLNRFSSSEDDGGDDDATSDGGGGQRRGQYLANERFMLTVHSMRTTTTEASARSSLSSGDAGGALATNDDENDNDEQFDPSLSKKARRKEQCRVNQANYRKRKRMYENELSGQIKLLEEEILELKARKIALHHQPEPAFDEHAFHYQDRDPIQCIGDFYYALESARLELPANVALRYPELHALFELQQQEFASIDAFQLQWLWYREQFAIFQLLVSSSERLDAGEQVIIRISAQLHIQMQPVNGGDQRRRASYNYDYQRGHEASGDPEDSRWFARKLVCPVLQQFEFHTHERVLTQITSEIDWLAGVAAVAQSPPEHTLLLLREFVNEVAASGYYNDVCC